MAGFNCLHYLLDEGERVAAGVLQRVDFKGAHYDAKKRTEMFTGSTSVVLAAQTILQAVVVFVSIELPLPDLASRDTTMPV